MMLTDPSTFLFTYNIEILPEDYYMPLPYLISHTGGSYDQQENIPI